MKEFNFNTLQSLPVPEQWIENALAIPETEEQRPAAVPFWRKPRYIAMAATLVLVSALSIALFLSMGKPPIAVKSGSKSPATEIVWSTDEYGATVATEVVVVPDGNTDQGGIAPTEPKSGLARFFEQLFGGGDDSSSATSPTTASGFGRGGRTTPTTQPSPADGGGTTPKPGADDGGKPSVTPTEAADDPEPIDDPDPVDDPTEEPTESPTESPWARPTEVSWEESTESGWQPRPTDPPKPTQNPYKTTIINTFSDFSYSSINGNTIYCRVYDSDGTEYGDPDLYSDQHIASLSLSGRRYTATYTPCDYGILPADGQYYYEFYTATGKVLARGRILLSAT